MPIFKGVLLVFLNITDEHILTDVMISGWGVEEESKFMSKILI